MSTRDDITLLLNDPKCGLSTLLLDHIITDKNKKSKEQIQEGIDSILEGFDYIILNKKEKILDSDYKKKDKNYDLDIYLNSQFWRMEHLIIGSISSWKEDNLLSGVVNSRHLYETIVHVFYLIDHLKEYINQNKHKEYFFLLWNFAYSVMSDFLLDEDKEQILDDDVIKPLVDRLPHINESLRYYINKANFFMKEEFKDEFEKENYTPADSTYRAASQVAHPNAIGSLHFYGKSYDNKTLFQKKQNDTKNHIFYNSIFLFLCELSNFTDYLKNFIKIHNQKFSFFCQKLSELNGGRDANQIIHEWKIEFHESYRDSITKKLKKNLN